MWLVAALALLAGGMGASLAVASRGDPVARLVGLDLASVVASLVFLLLAQGYSRSSYVDVALVLAPLGLAGVLVFSRLLGRPR